jgi:hypothetical protein
MFRPQPYPEMMKRYAIAALLLASGAHLTAQEIVTLNYGNNVVNGQTLAIVGTASTFELEASLGVTLNSDVQRTLRVKRYEVWPVDGTSNTFCWGECYIPYSAGERPLWVSNLTETLQPATLFDGFHAYYYPAGTEGLTKFRFVWYPTDAPTDTAYVDIVFDTRANAVGQQELTAAAPAVEVFPNPATGANLTLRFSGDLGGAQWVLNNALGAVERQGSLRAGAGDVAVNLDGLPSGVYFASIVRQGRMVATRRVVITR